MVSDKVGFQSSWTSGVSVVLYPGKDDPLNIRPEDTNKIEITPNSKPKLLAVSFSNHLSNPSASFQVTIAPGFEAEALFDLLADDDWIDITFYKHDKRWHTLRGLIDSIQRVTSVSGSGTTQVRFTITGRSFGKIWEITPVWFNPYATNELAASAAASNVLETFKSLLGPPDEVVEAYLSGFLEQIAGDSGADWKTPEAMPNVDPSAFINNVIFDSHYYRAYPPRRVFNPSPMQPEGTLWDLALGVGDEMFLEIYSDLLPEGGTLSTQINDPESSWDVDETEMTVVTRDRPFPVVADVSADQLAEDYTDYWGLLPVAEIRRQDIISLDVSKGGAERYNAFWVNTLLNPETDRDAIPLLTPLIDPRSVRYHGLRRFDVQSRMNPDPETLDIVTMAKIQRTMLRDWYVLNPYFLSGTIQLAHGRPDVHVGTRLRIAPTTKDDVAENYYIEGVSHSWSPQAGIRTTFEVTRGYVGTDADLREAIEQASVNYIEPGLIPPGD